MTDTVLDVRNLKVQFKTDEKLIRAVEDISFKVPRGQTLGIVGESGSGKSVTSLAVMGLVPTPGFVAGGEIWFRDAPATEPVNLLKLPPQAKQHYRGGRVSMIFQEPMSSLNPVYNIGFQLTEAILLHQNVSEKQARRQAVASLQEVKLLPSDEELRETVDLPPSATEREIMAQINQQKLAILKRYPHELSGGQIQRVMIAMAISCNPTLLIADEPTTALDVTVQATILQLLRELRDRRGMSMMFITHDLGVIAEIADTVVVMYQGQIVETGSVWQIFSNPQHPYTKGLLACRPQPERRLVYLPTVSDFMEVVPTAEGKPEIRAKSPGAAEVSEDARAEDTEGETPTPEPSAEMVAEVSPEQIEQRLTRLQQQEPLLEVQNLEVAFPIRGVFGQTKRYVMAVNGVSFAVYRGETLGLVGESGCGKTTLARTLLRLVEPSNGQIWFDGQDIARMDEGDLRSIRRQMQIVFQNPFSSLNPRMNIGALVMEPLNIHQVGGSRSQRRERAAYLLERVGLNAQLMNRYPHEFSGGQRQRVCIARALALNPKFIICDESVSALDVSVQAQVLNLLKEVQEEFSLTYIFISHDLSVVKFMSDRIMVMNQGKIEELDAAERIYRDPQKDYTRSLIASIPTGSLDRIREQQAARENEALRINN
ncbi:ABC transporter ATP-binding protein [Phormidium sp. CCY1219]|uniref:ABC transporter ATP-binding protein n=1 Tax=Phormidium sp. CCY1219 TaxID=2886104 RepID=UPI002D1F8E90|nr:ABC transporter ATP-binding protein [Phormidium sp. CCY1219]MEB3828296.1 ABC transporter ATP-binding protein [Phormidium sp. CCY1219]